MTVDKVCGPSQELGDSGQLVGIEILQKCGHVFSQWVDHVLDVRSLQCQMEDLLTAIVGVRLTTQVSSPLQPRDHPGNRATGQASDRAQIAASHRSAFSQQIEALVIGWT
jgi:hypothetical protein